MTTFTSLRTVKLKCTFRDGYAPSRTTYRFPHHLNERDCANLVEVEPSHSYDFDISEVEYPFPLLKIVHGNLLLQGETGKSLHKSHRFDLPSLERVHGEIDATNCAISMPKLQMIIGALNAQGYDGNLDRLETITGGLNLTGSRIRLPSLTTIAGDLMFDKNSPCVADLARCDARIEA